MNFFNLYGKAKKSLYRSKMTICAILFVLAAAAVIGTASLYDLRTQWNEKIATQESILKESANANSRLDIELKKLDAYSRLYSIANNIDGAIKNVNFFTSDDALLIIDSMPKGVTISKFALNDNYLEISGTLDSMETLPSIMQNLKLTGLFANVGTTSAALYRVLNVPFNNSDLLIKAPSDNTDTFSGTSSPGTENLPTEAVSSVENKTTGGNDSDKSSDVIVYNIGCLLKGSPLK